MRIQVTIFDDNSTEELEIPESTTAYDIIKKLNLQPDILIVTRDEQPIPIDELLKDQDKLKLIRVISGG